MSVISKPYFKTALRAGLANFGFEETLKMLVEECYANAQRPYLTPFGRKLAHSWNVNAAMLERAVARASRIAE